MTVSSTYTPPQYTGNGATSAFAFGYQFFATSDLIVNLFDTTANANVSPQPVLGGGATYDYTVTGVPDANTGEYPSGTVTFNTAPLANHRITITRSIAQLQPVSLTNNAAFPAKTVEAALDRATLLLQQAIATFATALQIPASDPSGTSVVLPPAATRASQYLGFDGSGNITALAAPISGTPVGAAMVPFIGSASLAAALALLIPGALKLTSVTAGAALETFLTLLRNKGAGAASDFLEALAFDGMNASTAEKTFARLYGQIVTATAAAEDGQLLLDTIQAGSLVTVLKAFKGLQLGAPTGGDKGLGTLNLATGLFLNGVNAGTIQIGTENVQNPIVASSASTVAHGLARTPDFTFLWLECLSAELSYAVGDRVPIGMSGQSTTLGSGVAANATNTIIVTGTLPALVARSGGAGGTITAAKWKISAQPILVNGGTFA